VNRTAQHLWSNHNEELIFLKRLLDKDAMSESDHSTLNFYYIFYMDAFPWRNAQKVLSVLQHGRHWVLVTLLVGNVIINETLPILLDHDVKAGWFAVLASTILIVIFGEIIPQSICAKYGLAIGAWSSR